MTNDPDYAQREMDKIERRDLRTAGYETSGLGGRVPSTEPTGELQRFARQGRREGVIGAVKDFFGPQFSFTSDPASGAESAIRKGADGGRVGVRYHATGPKATTPFSVTKYDPNIDGDTGRTSYHRTEDDAIMTANRLVEGNPGYEDRERYY